MGSWANFHFNSAHSLIQPEDKNIIIFTLINSTGQRQMVSIFVVSLGETLNLLACACRVHGNVCACANVVMAGDGGLGGVNLGCQSQIV